jgi:hypothetical protein
LALSLIHLLLEPSPISPFLVYAAFSPGPECLDFLARESYGDYKLAHLLQMIPDKKKRKVVRAVCMMERTEIVKAEKMYGHIVGRLVLDLGIDPTFFAVVREEEQHIEITRRLLGDLLLACQEPWEQRQFLAFTEGFRLELSIKNNIAKACLFSYKEKSTYSCVLL